ncbi:hypothetical protein [Ewingella americana]|uniref:hypothetical protein n=1 Tax=Ewingella americana TaxID=41202 RepID=UPI00163B558E|nr:hypothetical protein [Ewingella americana]QMV53573.1 hypothetical protein GXP68_21200 [Ewingella americana]
MKKIILFPLLALSFVMTAAHAEVTFSNHPASSADKFAVIGVDGGLNTGSLSADDIEKSNQRMASQISDLKSTVNDLQKQINEMDRTNSDNQSKISSLEKSISDLSSKIK